MPVKKMQMSDFHSFVALERMSIRKGDSRVERNHDHNIAPASSTPESSAFPSSQANGDQEGARLDKPSRAEKPYLA